jgi:hypothetical protein
MSERAPVDELGVRRLNREEEKYWSVEARAAESQKLAYAVRDFVLCTLPFKQPAGTEYTRRNGDMTLKIHASAQWGIPYGHDRLITIWLATAFFAAGRPADNVIRFRCASDILRAFGLSASGGKDLRQLRDRLQRVFFATYYLTFAGQSPMGVKGLAHNSYRLMDRLKMQFIDEKYSPVNQHTLWSDHVRLDKTFADELRAGGRVPVDLETVRALKDCTPALDLYIWQAWRSFRLARDHKPAVAIPVFGEGGLMQQLGSEAKSPKKIRAMLRGWQAEVKRVWQGCPNYLDGDCGRFWVHPGNAIASQEKIPILPGVSPTPPPVRELAGGNQLVLIHDVDDPHALLEPPPET